MDVNFLVKTIEKIGIELDKDIEAANNVISAIELELNDLNYVSEVLMTVLYIKKQEAKILIDIVNTGLKYIYPEKDLEFIIEFAEKNNRIVPEFYLNELKLKPPFIGDGGGVISTISVLIYVAMLKLKNTRIVLLDEIDSMIDKSAAEKLFIFLNEFGKNNNIKIMAITHKDFDFSHSSKITNKISLYSVGGE